MSNENSTTYRTNHNSVTIVGNIGQDAKFKLSGSKNTPIVTFNLANNGITKGQSDPTWVRIVGFNSIAKALGRYGRKGRKILITGRIESRRYYDHNALVTMLEDTELVLPDGTKVMLPKNTRVIGSADKYITEIVVHSYDFLDDKPCEPMGIG